MRLAVVLGTFNRLPLLKRAIETMRAAMGDVPHDFIVVDGGSSDGSREWLAAQPDVVLLGQRGELTGAVRAFNLGFSYAVERGYEYVAHMNDDIEVLAPDPETTPMHRGIFPAAIDLLKADPRIGEVAFEMDLWNRWGFDVAHGFFYANFGVIRREAGMAVARAQGDPSGRAWWNPIYRTYAADTELGCWLWKLGWKVHAAPGLRVHDVQPQDDLRKKNNADPERPDSKLFYERWPDSNALHPPVSERSWSNVKLHLGCGAKRLKGWVNVDGIRAPTVDVVADIEDLLSAIPEKSLSRVYWSHGPEHVFPDRLPAILKQLRRVLQVGSPLTVATIDLQKIYENRFLAANNGSAWNAALYGETDSHHHPYLAHRQAFTDASLGALLTEAGFSPVRPWQPEQYKDIMAINDYAVSCRLVTTHMEGLA